ncbi:MAG: DNRLRE domain-containing protein [Phycisphaerales bacterium]|nr:MAG: DNRLRE domain-containing protein [Phycisphaerales bacterium]
MLAAASISWTTARADQVILGAARDNTLYEQKDGLLSNGAGEFMFAGRTEVLGGGLIRRAVIAFDVAAAVPPDATVTRVELTLNMSKTIAGPADVELHRVVGDWGEGKSDAPGQEGGGAPSERGDATWIHTKFDAERWGSVGGDFVDAVSAVLSVAGPAFYTWGSTPQMVADVQGWVDDPDSDFGWALIGDEDFVGTAKRFDTHDNLIPENRPQLLIEFQPGACTGGEKLSARCKNKDPKLDLIKAKLSNGRDGASVTFRLDGDPNTDVVRSVRRGKAKAKFKGVADGDHVVALLECRVSKATTCE